MKANGMTAAAAVRPRVKVWLEARGEHVFCAQLCRILRAVAETGSIKEAAAVEGLSYRHVWGRLREVEASLHAPLVESHVGGRDARRSTLTETGAAMMESFTRLEARLRAAADDCAAELKDALRRRGV